MTQEGKVTIVQDDLGNVIRVSKNNPEYGHVRVTQDRVGFSATGWVKKQSKSTLIHGTVEDLKATGIQDAKELPGCIYTREQLEPFNAEDPDRDLKIAGATGIICAKDGEPIYRRSFYDATGTQQDELVAHNNGDAIREANADSDNTDSMVDPKSDVETTEQVVEEEVDVEDDVDEEVVVEEEETEFKL